MAKKPAAKPATDLAVADAFYHPGPEDLKAAGFRQIECGVWVWYSAGEGLGGYHIMVSLLPKSGEIFIHHTQGCRTETRYEFGKPITVGLGPNMPSKRFYCPSYEVFANIVQSYGWRHLG